jgi:hypothetical protein
MSGPPRGHWRRAALGFALVAVAATVLAFAELARDQPQRTGRAVSTTTTTQVPTSAPPTTEPTTTPTTAPATSPTEPGSSPAFRCWTGRKVATLDDCPEPSGGAGLAWVFPSLDLDACTDMLATETARQLRQLYECRARVAGRDVTISYVEWRSGADAIDFYDRQSPRRVAIRGRGGRPLRFGWLDVTASGESTGALAYTDAPFSVFVTAPDAATRSAVGHDLIRLRPTAELRGVPLRE